MDLKLKSGSSPMGMQNLIPHSFAQLILQGRCMKILLPRTSQRILFPWLPSSKVEIFKPEECHPCLVINNRLQTTNEVSKDKITIFSTVWCRMQDVKAAPDRQCILFFDWQIRDMEMFPYPKPEEFGIWLLTPPTIWGTFMWPLLPILTSC